MTNKTTLNRLYLLVKADFLHILRDSTLLVFFFAPLILLIFVQQFIPFLATNFPFLEPYQFYFVLFGSLQSSVLFGFITSFLILEEKDENVLQVIRVLPISSYFFIAYRVFLSITFSFIGAFLMLSFSGLVNFSWLERLLLASLYCLVSPFILLIVTSFAANKVEGLAYFKAINLLLIVPILVFFIDSVWMNVFKLVPVYWIYEVFIKLIHHEQVYFSLSVAVLLFSVYFAMLLRTFKKRVFDA